MAQTPDTTYAEGMADIESRMGLDPLHVLLARRQALVEQVADLRARYGSFGTFDAIRKSQLCGIRLEWRARAVSAGVKRTEAYLDDEAHADPRYIDLIADATRQRAELNVLEAKIEAIDAVIQRANAIARFLTAEAKL